MGLFDFFKKKSAPQQPKVQPKPSTSQSIPNQQTSHKGASDSQKPASSSVASLPSNIQNIIGAARLGLMGAQTGNSRMEQENLFNMFNLVQDACSQLLKIPTDQCNLVGSAFSLLLSYRQVRENEDLARAIADYAFFCLSKAINANPRNEMLHAKRLSVLAETRDFFYYTVANAMELPDSDPFDLLTCAPLRIRTNDYLYAMVKYDLSFMRNKNFDGPMGELIKAATNAMSNKTAQDGNDYIDKIMIYLINTFKKY